MLLSSSLPTSSLPKSLSAFKIPSKSQFMGAHELENEDGTCTVSGSEVSMGSRTGSVFGGEPTLAVPALSIQAFAGRPALPPIAPKHLHSHPLFPNISISLGFFSCLLVLLSRLLHFCILFKALV